MLQNETQWNDKIRDDFIKEILWGNFIYQLFQEKKTCTIWPLTLYTPCRGLLLIGVFLCPSKLPRARWCGIAEATRLEHQSSVYFTRMLSQRTRPLVLERLAISLIFQRDRRQSSQLLKSQIGSIYTMFFRKLSFLLKVKFFAFRSCKLQKYALWDSISSNFDILIRLVEKVMSIESSSTRRRFINLGNLDFVVKWVMTREVIHLIHARGFSSVRRTFFSVT